MTRSFWETEVLASTIGDEDTFIHLQVNDAMEVTVTVGDEDDRPVYDGTIDRKQLKSWLQRTLACIEQDEREDLEDREDV